MANAFARRRYDRDTRQGHPRAIAQFIRRHGYRPDFKKPSTHSERVYLRKLRDHDPRFAELTDKVAVRDYINRVLGPGSAASHCVPILAHVRRFRDLPDTIWSQDVILKCTHGSGMNCIVPAHDTKARNRARRRIRGWLGKVHGARRFEWCYLGLTPSIIAEPLFAQVRDIKLYFYDGVLRYVMAEDNSAKTPAISVYTPSWEYVPIKWAQFDTTVQADPPAQLSDMINIATPLAQGFDMIRIDFLLTPQRPYLGELTLYDASGLAATDTYENDRDFAAYWRQPHLGCDRGGA